MSTREQRKSELTAMLQTEAGRQRLNGIWIKAMNLPFGMAHPVGRAVIHDILKAEFPNEDEDSRTVED